MVQVSVLGGLTLLVAVWSLLAPGRGASAGGAALRRASPALAAFYMAWLVDAYVAVALGGLVRAPVEVVSLGVWGFKDAAAPAAAQLLLQLLATLAVAGLCRAHSTAPAAAAAATAAADVPAGPSALPTSTRAAAGACGRSSDPSEAVATATAVAAAAADVAEVGGGGGGAIASRSASMAASDILHLLSFRGEQRASSDGASSGLSLHLLCWRTVVAAGIDWGSERCAVTGSAAPDWSGQCQRWGAWLWWVGCIV
jgi:hypothetical protein